MMTPLDFAAQLMVYASRFGGSVTSWGRSPERNKAVGGHKYSKHLVWLGADVGYHPNPVPVEEDRRRVANQLGLTLVIEADHDHLQSV